MSPFELATPFFPSSVKSSSSGKNKIKVLSRHNIQHLNLHNKELHNKTFNRKKHGGISGKVKEDNICYCKFCMNKVERSTVE